MTRSAKVTNDMKYSPGMHGRDGDPEALVDPALRFLRTLWRVEHALERASKRMEDTIGISGPQRFALRVNGAVPGLGASELAAILHLHPSTVTGVLQRLAARGLIRRAAHARDGRRMHLHLTRAGARVNRPTAKGTVEQAVRTTLGQCSPAKAKATADVLNTLFLQLMKL
jgi:DNA-binding MarR family transcriptional regulator